MYYTHSIPVLYPCYLCIIPMLFLYYTPAIPVLYPCYPCIIPILSLYYIPSISVLYPWYPCITHAIPMLFLCYYTPAISILYPWYPFHYIPAISSLSRMERDPKELLKILGSVLFHLLSYRYIILLLYISLSPTQLQVYNTFTLCLSLYFYPVNKQWA